MCLISGLVGQRISLHVSTETNCNFTANFEPVQKDRGACCLQVGSGKLLKKAENSDIVYCLEHNRISRRCIRKGEVTNMLMTMLPREELDQEQFLCKYNTS